MPAERTGERRPRHDGPSTLALLLGLAAALIPLFTVIAGGAWAALAFVFAGILLGASYLLRRAGLGAIVVTPALLVVWTALITAVFFSDVAWLFVIPSGEAFARVPRLIEIASSDIAVGVAPLQASASLTFLIVGAVGLLTIALDHVVLTARMPLLAGVALIAVWLIPTLAVPQAVDLWAFALLALALLWLLRTETRAHDEEGE
ncbi:transglutaminaseTgpA domain-containing protein [Microbacterium oleivorans]|uniref:Transglutaminase domain-containing protein n=1 Tax=Microbacterium oleivorans TaxID=273677 RepID=A0A031FLU3_9MICO|nr:transglutaminaseTgpA domain-containing protein [Microbacterium oleivorans]EZP25156.1 Transglutaminase domain-containing protein [Microbacterium oleivorans]